MADTIHEQPGDPFEDPAGPGAPSEQATLAVDRTVTLTLGTDSLIIFDEGLRHQRSASNCCGLLPSLAKSTRAVPFHHVLWAEFTNLDVTVHYAQPVGRRHCAVAYCNYTLTDKSTHTDAREWVERLMQRAYPPRTQRQRRVKVLVNPFGGQGYAQRIWARQAEPIFAAARTEMDVEVTRSRGHAIEIAARLDIDAYDAVICASGDGLPHEVFNGLAKHPEARRALRKIAVVQLPCGSGNALSLNLNGTNSPSMAALEIVKGVRSPMDLIAITQGQTTLYSFLSQAVGIIAETDLGTESLRWMGSFRFTWGILVRLLGKMIYPAQVSMVLESDDKRAIREAYYQNRQIHEAGETRFMRPESIDASFAAEQASELPALQYGTINDPLHPAFVTTDMPNLGNFYVGNACWMTADAPFFAAALPSDGLMDMMTADGTTPRRKALEMVMKVEDGTMMNFPEVGYRKVRAYRITPRVFETKGALKFWTQFGQWLGGAGNQTEPLISIDGESVPWAPYQAEIMPGLGTVLSKHGGVYEFDGPQAM